MDKYSIKSKYMNNSLFSEGIKDIQDVFSIKFHEIFREYSIFACWNK